VDDKPLIVSHLGPFVFELKDFEDSIEAMFSIWLGTSERDETGMRESDLVVTRSSGY